MEPSFQILWNHPSHLKLHAPLFKEGKMQKDVKKALIVYAIGAVMGLHMWGPWALNSITHKMARPIRSQEHLNQLIQREKKIHLLEEDISFTLKQYRSDKGGNAIDRTININCAGEDAAIHEMYHIAKKHHLGRYQRLRNFAYTEWQTSIYTFKRVMKAK